MEIAGRSLDVPGRISLLSHRLYETDRPVLATLLNTRTSQVGALLITEKPSFVQVALTAEAPT
jgi:hypothetical protein